MRQELTQAYVNFFLAGQKFSTIIEARRFAESELGQSVTSGTALTKQIDEAIEAAIVRVARTLVQSSHMTHEAYDRLTDLLERQPNLSVRSSTSVLQQAYSTPIPIAYLASALADITSETTVYEPTAGNGALLIAANPEKVIVNEINSDRFTELVVRGYFKITQKDAVIYQPQETVDRVICNPPFGSVLDENYRTQRFQIYDSWTTQIDQVIAFKALEVMKEDGRAVLILGGKKGSDTEWRSDRYNTRESRGFYHLLYNRYNVTQHFSVWGDLYRKQGAAFPIDIVVIEGRGRSQRVLPAAEVPIIYESFAQLKELLPNESIRQLSQPLVASREAIAFRRQSPSRNRVFDREAVQIADSTAARLDDSALDDGVPQHSGANADATARTSASIIPLSGLPSPEWRQRGGRDKSAERLATGLGRNANPLQRSLQPIAEPQQRQLSRNSAQQDSSRLSTIARDSSGNPSGRMAPRSDSLTIQASAPALNMDANLSPQSIQNTDDQPKQVPYVSKSKGQTTGTLIPANMASAAQAALEQFEQTYGSIDEYLADRLGYTSVAELHQYFSAEQVDASALAIGNIERGSGFITGDQTGVGKGRICASILRYARQQGKEAIFVTQKKTLYADMMRDVSDIGMYNFNPFITDTNAEIPLPNGQALTTGGAAQQERAMREMIGSRSTGMFYNAVFTTYNQLQTVGQKEPLRREFLRAIASNAILILDEAHEAGGTKNERKPSMAFPDRAEFVRELVDSASGVFYSSATYAKRPDVMDLYARRTDLRLAVSRMDALENLLNRGGVPLQQMVASKFVASGQMLRRERSFEGIRFQAKVVSVDREVADQFSAAMRAIKDFDKAKQMAIKELDQELKKAAKAISEDGSIGAAGAKSTNFTSLMHNCIEQGLLAQKAEATVQEAVHSLQTGQKPVIAVANTMGSFIQAFADVNDLNPGDAIDLSFANLLERYLERSRDVLLRNYQGHTTRHRLTDEELGEVGLMAYEDALETIQEGDFSGVPVSPIDYITQRLEQSGYRVAEVTGRSAGLNYLSNGSTTYKVRSSGDRTPRARIDAVAQFNSGDADVIILNCSGSTGISLHASEKFADQRSRHMIVAQAERDINVFMQMLGRVHRTGQVALPSYTLLMGDLPAEKRPGAILAKKMASLNANTTAARETDISIQNVVDFMNAYGEQVVTDLFSDDPELDAKLDFPLAKAAEDFSDTALIKLVTGRIPLLPIAEQETVYTLIETEYRELVEQQRAMGESILEADQLDLDARTLARMEVIPADSAARSEFTGAVYLEVVDTKSASLSVVNFYSPDHIWI